MGPAFKTVVALDLVRDARIDPTASTMMPLDELLWRTALCWLTREARIRPHAEHAEPSEVVHSCLKLSVPRTALCPWDSRSMFRRGVAFGCEIVVGSGAAIPADAVVLVLVLVVIFLDEGVFPASPTCA